LEAVTLQTRKPCFSSKNGSPDTKLRLISLENRGDL
jgi:hypothetical protein